MSRLDRTIGLIRSLAIYHGIPFRQAGMRRFYAPFVASGDLVFDVGAHAGNRARAFASMGCCVVALEPQPAFARILRWLFGRSLQVEVLEMAVSRSAGHITLAISDRFPTVTTIAAPWREARGTEPDFSGVEWNRRVEVETTTLDLLIARFGTPTFIKIDVEGAEPDVLAGLSQPVRALSFEYLPRVLDHVPPCLDHLATLGHYEFNWSLGETYRMGSAMWVSGPELLAALATPEAQKRPGDVFARLVAART